MSASPAPAHTCFHCGLPVPAGVNLSVTIDRVEQPMCCAGCQAVARAIVDNGLTDYYRQRTAAGPTGHELVPDALKALTLYDQAEVQRSFVRDRGDLREASLILEGITCAACLWLNERHLQQLDGVHSASINYATRRARVQWDNRRIHLSDILGAIEAIGYRAHPYDPSRQQQLLEAERRTHLKRLGLAGIMGMQVMVLAVAMYLGDWTGMEQEFRRFFAWTSLLLTLPVLLYSARPFLDGAIRDLRHRQAGMDVPVTLGIGLAFAGSVIATWQGQGHVYYDSVVMFVFFLLSARYFEMVARKRAAETSEALVQAVPMMARLLCDDGTEEWVAAARLRPGDRVRVRPGETVPADGEVAEGRSSVDESLLTGEPRPIAKGTGDPLTGGSVNVDSPLLLQVTRVGEDTVLSTIQHMMEQAQTAKPRLAQLADRAASGFVTAIVLLATGVGIYWYQAAPEQWLPITVAVLVVTCPCALSLATPTALAATAGTLTRLGLIPTGDRALETLARIDHFVFDKTGTLTLGRPRLSHTIIEGERDPGAVLRLAAALEAHSEHPVARAVREAPAAIGPLPPCQDPQHTPGGGITGFIDGMRYWIGNPDFVSEHSGCREPQGIARDGGDGTAVWLADEAGLLARFAFTDELRPGARETIDRLKAMGITPYLFSGDQPGSVARVANELGIASWQAQLTPAGKLEAVRKLQATGAVVAMAGDGVNDAPVLAAANVSLAMGQGTQLAAASADMILLNEQLPLLATGVRQARRTLAVIRQNLVWAILYNLGALPLAALGWIAPWLAALGMSASSLVVVANALRLTHYRNPTD